MSIALCSVVVFNVRVAKPAFLLDFFPQPTIGVGVSVRGSVGSRIVMDDVVIFRIATHVRRSKVGLRSLVRLVKAEIHAVDIEMVERSTRRRTSHLSLQVAREHVSQECIATVSLERPRIVLSRPKIDFGERVSSVVCKKRIVQAAFAMQRIEEQSKRMLGVVCAAAKSATNSQPDVVLKSDRTVRVQ